MSESYFYYVGVKKWNYFYILDLWTNALVPCSEIDFHRFVYKFRDLYVMKRKGPNIQDFYLDGELYARRSKNKIL